MKKPFNEFHIKSFRYLAEIKKTCENLISQTQTDLELFKVCQTNQIDFSIIQKTHTKSVSELLKFFFHHYNRSMELTSPAA